ncbi:MAG: hypothetical protein U0491_01805 [Candidatus Saccharimonadales bacterium]
MLRVFVRVALIPTLLLFGILGLGVISTTVVHATINNQISFQGKLTNPDGTNVTNGTYSIVFSLYTVASGGAAVWTETQGSVSVTDGIFQVNLGSVTSLPGSVDFNSGSIYLGVKVGADPEMTPRILFTASPYAFNSDKLGGIAASGFVQLSPGSQQTGFINISGNATVGGTYNGNTFTSSNLTFSAASAASIQSAASQALNIDSGSSGSLGLGSSNATSITLGKFGTMTTTAGSLSVNSGTNIPTTDQVVIDNTSSTGVATAGVNGLNVKYKGGAAAVEAAGIRIDYTPGTTSGGIWSGMRIVEAVAAASGVNSYGLKLEGAGSGAGNSYGIEVATGWDIGIDVQSGGLQLAAQTDPATPSAGNLRIYAKDIAGRVMPKFVGPSGVDTPFQSSFGFNRIAMMAPAGSGTNCSTSLSIFGSTATGAGTCSYTAVAATNLKTSVRRMNYSSGATAGTVAYQRQAALMAWRGNAAGVGGFFYTTRFGMNTLQTGNRAFVGMSDSIANPTNVDPTTNTTPGKIGMAINANTGNWNFVNNVTGTAPTVTNLGLSFPVDTTSLYELILFSAPNGSSIGWRVTNLSTGAQTSGSASTNIPAQGTFLNPVFWVTNNTTNAAAIFETAGWYLESDN